MSLMSSLVPGAFKKRTPPKPHHQPVRTSYTSNDVPIPADFLSAPPTNGPVTLTRIDWSKTPLPENGDRFAVVLDNVLTADECAQLLRLAEASATDQGTAAPTTTGSGDGDGDGDKKDEGPWRPAMVNLGPGWEILEPNYRNSDRIVWDQQDVVDRLWRRCALAPGLREELAEVEGVSRPDKDLETSWRFHRFNKRMRFLRYQRGQFFRPHCDGPYGEETDDGAAFRTHFTVHLYLNDSAAEAAVRRNDDDDDDKKKADHLLVGGATSFLSGDEKRRVDVDPKAGRVLIFQHSRLYHSGDDVVSGTKYTMRTDILYELFRTQTAKAEGKAEEPDDAGAA